MSYDPFNIFAKILRQEIPVRAVAENNHALAFADIHPKAPIHILVIPKGSYSDFFDFQSRAQQEEVLGFYSLIHKIIQEHDLAAQGFRLIANTGLHGGQEVPHYHVHILGGQALGSPFGA